MGTTMRARPSLTGEQLQFDRSGSYVLTAGDDGVSIINSSSESRHPTLITRSSVQAFAGFADQIWFVESGILHRLDLQGRSLGEPFVLPAFAEPSWSPAPCGPAGIVWHAEPALGIVEDLGTLSAHAHRDADLHIPLTARRVIAVLGTGIHMPSGLVATVPIGTRTVAGVALSDGKAAVLVTVQGLHRALVTIAFGSGQLVSRHVIPNGSVRIATQRAIAAIQLEPRRIGLVDLRLARELGSLMVEEPIDDFAIAPDGRQIVVKHGSSDHAFLPISQLLLEARVIRARGNDGRSVSRRHRSVGRSRESQADRCSATDEWTRWNEGLGRPHPDRC